MKTTKTIELPPVPKIVWQQRLGVSISVNHHKLVNFNDDIASKTTQKTQRLKMMKLYDVAS